MKKVSVVDFPEEITESGVKIYGKISYDTCMAVLSQYLHNGLFDAENAKETEEIHNEIILAIRDYFDRYVNLGVNAFGKFFKEDELPMVAEKETEYRV